MSFICGLKVDKKVLLWIIGLAVIITLLMSICSCPIGADYIPMEDKKRPQNTNEKVYIIHNKAHLTISQFLVYSGKWIEAKLRITDWKIYKIRVLGHHTLDGTWEIHTIAFYYEESDE